MKKSIQILFILTFGIIFFTALTNAFMPRLDLIETSCLPGNSYQIGDQITCIIEETGSINFENTTVSANLTLPDGTNQNLTISIEFLYDSGKILSTTSFAPTQIGTYTLTWSSQDYLSGNLFDSTQLINLINVVSSLDKTNPSLIDLTTTAQLNAGETLSILAQATDNVQVASVVATIDYPDGITTTLPLTTSDNLNYELLFSDTSLDGKYVYHLIATDTSGNIKQVRGSFKVIAPANAANLAKKAAKLNNLEKKK